MTAESGLIHQADKKPAAIALNENTDRISEGLTYK